MPGGGRGKRCCGESRPGHDPRGPRLQACRLVSRTATSVRAQRAPESGECARARRARHGGRTGTWEGRGEGPRTGDPWAVETRDGGDPGVCLWVTRDVETGGYRTPEGRYPRVG